MLDIGKGNRARIPCGMHHLDHGRKDAPNPPVMAGLGRAPGPNCNQTGGKLELNWCSSGLRFHGNMMAVRWWGRKTQVGEDANSS